MPEITAVTFDLWQTLLLDNPEMGRVRSEARLQGTLEALQGVGQYFELAVIEEAYRSGIRRCQDIRANLRDVTFNQQVEIFLNEIAPGLGHRLPAATFNEIALVYSDSFFVHPARPHPEGVRVLQSVKDMGLRLGLISNTGMTPGVSFRRFLDEHGMLGYFEALTFSDEVGMSKPASEMFTSTLSQLDSIPTQAIHVGDHIFNDVAAAKECGMKTVWIEGFYERPDLSDSATLADETVSGLGEVPDAIKRLAAAALAGCE